MSLKSGDYEELLHPDHRGLDICLATEVIIH
jgi:hypothetical protein